MPRGTRRRDCGYVRAHTPAWLRQRAYAYVADRSPGIDPMDSSRIFSLDAFGTGDEIRAYDVGIATLVGAWNQLNCGTTTLGDWCHNNPTPAHSDAAVDALLQSGIRAVFLHGSPKPDPGPGRTPASEMPYRRDEVERLLAGPLRDRAGLVTLGLAILGPGLFGAPHVSRHDLRLAREFDLVASMHQGGGPPKTPGGWEALTVDGLLGPRVNVVHGNDLSDSEIAQLVGLGVTFSVAPEGEMTQGHGFPIIGRLRHVGAPLSLGVDLESAFSGDMITVARMALALQRCVDNAESRRDRGKIPDTSTISAREALAWITRSEAQALGLSGTDWQSHAGQAGRYRRHRCARAEHAAAARSDRERRVTGRARKCRRSVGCGEVAKAPWPAPDQWNSEKLAELARSGRRIVEALGVRSLAGHGVADSRNERD